MGIRCVDVPSYLPVASQYRRWHRRDEWPRIPEAHEFDDQRFGREEQVAVSVAWLWLKQDALQLLAVKTRVLAHCEAPKRRIANRPEMPAPLLGELLQQELERRRISPQRGVGFDEVVKFLLQELEGMLVRKTIIKLAEDLTEQHVRVLYR